MILVDYIPHFIILTTMGSGLAGYVIAGRHDQDRELSYIGVFGWGGALAALLLSMGYVLVSYIGCAGWGVQSSGNIGMTNGGCDDRVKVWYAVIRQWETGIGAAIGLLGVAWSTFYKSVFGGDA